MNRLVIASAVLFGLVSLAGCSSQPAPTPTSTPTVTLPAAQTPAEAKASYKAIAEASCNKAQAEGVTETSDNFTAVMTPKSQHYKDFSAAYLVEPEEYGLIWELDALVSCADWYTFSMADEAGSEAAIEVTFDPADSTYQTVEDFGDVGIYTYRFTVVDGRVATSVNVDKPSEVTTITYGAIGDSGLDILMTAVDQHLAEG